MVTVEFNMVSAPPSYKGGLNFQILAFKGKLPYLPETKGGLLVKGYEIFRFEYFRGDLKI